MKKCEIIRSLITANCTVDWHCLLSLQRISVAKCDQCLFFSENPSLRAIGVDCSKRAIEFLDSRWNTIRTSGKLMLVPRRKTPNRRLTTNIVSSERSDGADKSFSDEDTIFESLREQAAQIISDNRNKWHGGELIKTLVWDITKVLIVMIIVQVMG